MATLDLIGEFLNTVDHRTFSRHGENHVAAEHLTSPRALADWLVEHGLLSEGVALRPGDLTAAVALRTALRQTLGGEPGAPGAPGGSVALTDHRLGLVPDASGGLRLAARSGRPWLDTIVETVAHGVARGDWRRVKLCAAPDCRWAFYDTSRNGQGRWCSMEICGNRHKTRTYRERRQRAG